ncbi:MAG TPA: tRNA (adenosine(37)-N6)-threonylcarbamoyltransferase complex transferase subunit TsaD [Candidatus Saccharimonadales bacterium]|nr:tRNA (adenosine(37)-N6)-threonylcarbamoyltransferase complex transferase subunit TsaD [Candidatus Saccharimonadales bacterium]
MKVLGIESSCDETAAAVVENGDKLLSNVVASSIDMHKAYGGVVPEIAARSHIESITPVIRQALAEASCNWQDIDGIAVTYGPGLGGSLLVGVLSARTLAILHDKPLYGVNHVKAHVCAAFITQTSKNLAGKYELSRKKPDFPLLALIVSGGHTQLVLFKSHSDYEILGRTADDAVGEAYDKVAKMLGLPYPGGPSVEKLAVKGDPGRFKFPKARTGNEYGFSYSGLKTAVLRTAQSVIGEDYTFPSHMISERLSEVQKTDIAAGFSRAALDVLVEKTEKAYKACRPDSVVVAGGVSASPALRKMMAERLPIKPYFPDIKLCTDNGAMVAVSGYYQAVAGEKTDPRILDIAPSLSM